MSFTIYSDGSGTRRGSAGIGFVVLRDGLPFNEGSRPLVDATHQEAELLAAKYALDSLPAGQEVKLYSDSKFLVRGFNDYLPTWRITGWRKFGGGPVAHPEHWQDLIAAVDRHRDVRFEWIPRAQNESADRLAGEARMSALPAPGNS